MDKFTYGDGAYLYNGEEVLSIDVGLELYRQNSFDFCFDNRKQCLDDFGQ